MAKSDDKFERLLGKENLARLSIFQAGLTPANMGTFGKDYADQMGGTSMFEPLFAMERANRIAEGYGAKTAATEALGEKLDNIATPQAREIRREWIYEWTVRYRPQCYGRHVEQFWTREQSRDD
jgi:hypothetical protein